MGVVSGILVYVVLWWVVLFTVLPWWVQTPKGETGANDAGAPIEAKIGKKFLITSAIAFLAWLVVYALVNADIPWLNDLFMKTGY